MSKKVASLFLVVFILTGLLAPAYAMEIENEGDADADNSTVTVTSDMIKVCNLVFDGNGELYNSDGDDVTENFIIKYNDFYMNKDYISIVNAFNEEGISNIYAHGNKNSAVQPIAFMDIPYDEVVVHLVTQNEFPYNGKSWYFIVEATGTYVYQISGYIYSFPTPTINVSYSGLGELFSGSLTSINVTTPVLNSSKNEASFTVTTQHEVSCPIPGLDYITGTLGPFTNVSNFKIVANY